jgi:hypothetical protein
MKAVSVYAVLIFTIPILLLCGCVEMIMTAAMTSSGRTYEKPEFPEPLTPIRVNESESIAVHRIVIKIPYGTGIGYLHYLKEKKELKWESSTLEGSDEFIDIGTGLLQSNGYKVVEPTDDLFSRSVDQTRSRFQLGGVITSIYINSALIGNAYDYKQEGDAEVVVEWQLYDTTVDQIVFTKRTTGRFYYPQSDESIDVSGFILEGYRIAVTNLLAVQDFSDIVTMAKDTLSTIAEHDELNVNFTSRSENKKIDNISKLFSSVVTIQSGLNHGTGVIISQDGHVLTVAHVVSGVEKVSIIFESGLQLEAEVLRTNKASDSAIVKIKGQKFNCLPVKFEQTDIGEDVFIISTPLDKTLSFSVTRGIISSYREKGEYRIIQTDAAINPGSSGGPIFDSAGRIIGIVSSKIAGDVVEGIGFGITVNTVFSSLNIVNKQ